MIWKVTEAGKKVCEIHLEDSEEAQGSLLVTIYLFSPFSFFLRWNTNCLSRYSAPREEYLLLDPKTSLVSLSHFLILGTEGAFLSGDLSFTFLSPFSSKSLDLVYPLGSLLIIPTFGLLPTY